MTEELTSVYKGGSTADKVREIIRARFGEQEAEEYDPYTNCYTFKRWKQEGYQVKKGQKGIRSFTVIEKTDKHGNKETYSKTCYLFAKCQVDEISN
jgi:hypothetical protein